MERTREMRPDLFEAIMRKITPHKLDAVLCLMEGHLRRYDLQVFEENREAVPEFVWAVVKHMRFPEPGTAQGINQACRASKSDTQAALDSKHNSSSSDSRSKFNVERNVLHELALFSTQKQVFEFSNRRRYASVYTDCPVENLMNLLPEACHLVPHAEHNKGRNSDGKFQYLSTFKYIIVEDRGSVKILYQSLRDLYGLLRRIAPNEIVAFSDVRNLFQKCGIVSHFFNMIEIVERQLFINDDSAYEKDVLTLMKYQCRSGKPLPLTRDGLAKNPDRTQIEVVSFEAVKKNLGKFSTGEFRNQWFNGLSASADRMFFGQMPCEGDGYSFAVRPKSRIKKIKKCNKLDRRINLYKSRKPR